MGKDIAVYFESWASQWTSSAYDMDMTKIDNRVTIVNIAFVQPNTSYKLGQKSFTGTGLQFSQDFALVRDAIGALRARGVKVLLSVGGATYPFVGYNATACAALCSDLGCSGIDLDWEPSNGAAGDGEFGPIINAFRNVLPDKYFLSAAVWSIGAFAPDGNNGGMNVKGIQSNGSQLDWINIMAYDAGPLSSYDPVAALKAYRAIYQGSILLGFCVGNQSWGGALLTESDVTRSANGVLADSKGGVFIWSWLQKPFNTPTPSRVVEICSGLFGTPVVTPPVVIVPPVVAPIQPVPAPVNPTLQCPNCKKSLTLTLS